MPALPHRTEVAAGASVDPASTVNGVPGTDTTRRRTAGKSYWALAACPVARHHRTYVYYTLYNQTLARTLSNTQGRTPSTLPTHTPKSRKGANTTPQPGRAVQSCDGAQNGANERHESHTQQQQKHARADVPAPVCGLCALSNTGWQPNQSGDVPGVDVFLEWAVVSLSAAQLSKAHTQGHTTAAATQQNSMQ